MLIQKSRIESKVGGTISPTEIDSLNYEPVEDSEEFYVDMGMHIACLNKLYVEVMKINFRSYEYFHRHLFHIMHT